MPPVVKASEEVMGKGHEDSLEGAQVETSRREMLSERCRPSRRVRIIDPVESPERHKRKDKKRSRLRSPCR